MKRRTTLLWPLTVLMVALSAAAARAEKIVLVTSNGWHTGIVVARADLPPGLIPEIADFPAAAYFEFGWGNRDYYTTPRKTLGLTLGAALPSTAVVHLAAYARPPRAHPGYEAVALPVSDEGFRRLAAYLHRAFARAGDTRARAIAAGLQPMSGFYPATGRFHLFNTCNTWTAAGLAAAGVAIGVGVVQRSEDLMSQIRALARSPKPALSQ